MTIQLSVPEYFGIGVALIVLGRAIHYLTVTRYLRDNNIAVAGGSSFRDWNEWSAYRKGRIADHQSLTWWYILWAIQFVLFFWMVGWFAFAAGALKLVTPSHFIDNAPDAVGYRTVFDVAQSGYHHWPFALFGLIFVVVGFAMPALIRLGIVRKSPAWMQKWFPRIFVVFGTLWTAAVLAGTFVDYRKAVNALRNDEAKVVEGRVEHYSQVPTKSESFEVNGVKFWYSDNVVIAGFNHTAFHGGPIRPGLPVKIWYWRGEILRLEIKEAP
jgi:hypothetical protein